MLLKQLFTLLNYVSVAAGERETQTSFKLRKPPKEAARINKEILVKVLNSKEANITKKLSAENIIAKIKQDIDITPTFSKVIAVKKLTNENVILYTANTANKFSF
jgi:hypothetical protein